MIHIFSWHPVLLVPPAGSRIPHSANTWWRHQMETFSALLALCAGNSPVPVNSPHKGQWRGALMFSLICALNKRLRNNRETGDVRRYSAHYDVIVIHWHIASWGPFSWQRLNGIRAWMSNYNHCNIWDVITHPSPNLNGGLGKPSLNLRQGGMIISHYFMWM